MPETKPSASRNSAYHAIRSGVAARRDVDLRAEQPCGVGLGRFGQQKGDGECRAAHQSRFEDQFEHDFPFRRAQQAARGHLLGAESGLCGRQVDVVDDSEEQDDDADCHEDRHERAVARREVPVAVEGRKIDLPQGQERYLPVKVADVRQIDRFEIVEHVGKFGPQVGPFACQQKGAARPYIAHAFVVIVLLRQQIAAVEQVDRRDDRTLDVAHHGADGVALPLGDERTPHGIGVAEHPARERFGEDDVVVCGERLPPVAGGQFEVEDAEEGRVGRRVRRPVPACRPPLRYGDLRTIRRRWLRSRGSGPEDAFAGNRRWRRCFRCLRRRSCRPSSGSCRR